VTEPGLFGTGRVGVWVRKPGWAATFLVTASDVYGPGYADVKLKVVVPFLGEVFDALSVELARSELTEPLR